MNTQKIIEFLKSDSAVDAQLKAFERLKNTVTEKDLPTLLEALKSETSDFWVRELLSEPILELAGAKALPDLLEALQKNYDEGHDNDSFATFLMDLAESDPVGVKKELKKLELTATDAQLEDINWLLEYCE